jgi:hypothetical protein
MSSVFEADSKMSQMWVVRSLNLSTENECRKAKEWTWNSRKYANMHRTSVAILSRYLTEVGSVRIFFEPNRNKSKKFQTESNRTDLVF